MKKAPIPQNESERLQELEAYKILDTGSEDNFDEITKLAMHLCGSKIALISLIDKDRQWFKSKQGLDASETPRDISYCGHAIMDDEVFIINDAKEDERFCDNPLLTGEPHVRFYAGAPLISPRGLRIGTLCVIDDKPKILNENQIDSLRLLSKSVINLLELRTQNTKLNEVIELSNEIQAISQTGSWSYNLIKDEVTWSSEVYSIYEIDKGTPITLEIAKSCYEGHELQRVEKAMNDAINNKRSYDDIFEFKSVKGNNKWVRSIGKCSYDSQGNPIKIFGTFQDVTSLKSKELAIIDAKNYLEIALDSSKLGVWDWYLDTNKVYFDKHWAKMLGINHDNLIMEYDSWESRVHPEDLPHTLKYITDYIEGKTSDYTNIHRMKHENGEWVYILVHGKFSRWDFQGKPLRFTGTHQDITHVKKREIIESLISEIRKKYIENKDDTQAFFSFVLNSLLELTESENGFISEVITIDNEKRLKTFAIVNKQWDDETTNNYKLKTESGLDSPTLTSYYEDVLKTNKPISKDTLKDQPHIYNYVGIPLIVNNVQIAMIGLSNKKNGYPEDFFKSIESLTEAIAEVIAFFMLERMTREHEIERKVILESTGVALWVYYPESKTLYWDNSMYQLYEINEADFSGAYDAWSESLYEDDKENAEIDLQLALDGKKQFDTIFRIKTRSNTIKYIRARAEVLRSKDGTPIKLMGVNWDYTSEKLKTIHLQEAKERAEIYSKAKSDFLANMSHEIRTPLNGVLGMINLLSETKLSSKQRELVQISQNSGLGLLEIINDILDLSKIESGQLEIEEDIFPLKNFLSDILNLNRFKAKEKNIDLITSGIDANGIYINTDQTRLKQIINNLISNAIKFTNAGSVEINIQLNENLIIKVIDTGIGIDQDIIKYLFTPFKQADASITRNFGGTGLGLSICKELTSLLRGKISVSSILNKGSTFIVSIPTTIVEGFEGNYTEEGNSHEEKSLSITFPHHILIVEDNPVNQKLASMTLSKFGYTCTIAGNGRIALDLINEDNKYDFILMDLQMPEMDGISATKEIRKIKGYSPTIVAMTANVFKEDQQRCKEAGMDAFLSKPFKKQSLIDLLTKK